MCFRCFHRRDSASHFSGVLMMISPLSRSFKSAAVSPVSSTTLANSPNFCSQSLYLSFARASMGAIYTTRMLLSPDSAFW
uniref:U520, putative n=1 Tax=Arundo donax TaxID=35708 RepID=A0A0A9EDN4_ARUDO